MQFTSATTLDDVPSSFLHEEKTRALPRARGLRHHGACGVDCAHGAQRAIVSHPVAERRHARTQTELRML